MRVGGAPASGGNPAIPGGYVRLDADDRATGRPAKKGSKTAAKSSKKAASDRTQRNFSPIAALKAAVKKAAKKGAKRSRR
jgi:hypothetical protein